MDNINTVITALVSAKNTLRTLASNETNVETQKAMYADLDAISEASNRLSKLPVNAGLVTPECKETFSNDLFGSEAKTIETEFGELVATIKHSDNDRSDRVTLRLVEDGDRFVWLAKASDEGEYKTEIDGKDIDEAIEACCRAYADYVSWDLEWVSGVDA